VEKRIKEEGGRLKNVPGDNADGHSERRNKDAVFSMIWQRFKSEGSILGESISCGKDDPYRKLLSTGTRCACRINAF